MNVEFEATFANINKDKMRQQLKVLGAQLIKPEFLQKRVVFNFPAGHEIEGGWLRVRDEDDKTTMSLKVISGEGIESQKEIEIIVNDFLSTINFLNCIGCKQKAYQESKRELWQFDKVEITIDEWPFLEPFIEIEGSTEQDVKSASEKLGYDYSQALFDSVDGQYSKKYGISKDTVNQRTPKILFKMENPFLNRND